MQILGIFKVKILLSPVIWTSNPFMSKQPQTNTVQRDFISNSKKQNRIRSRQQFCSIKRTFYSYTKNRERKTQSRDRHRWAGRQNGTEKDRQRNALA